MLYLLGWDFWPTRRSRSTRYTPGAGQLDKSWNSIPTDAAEEPRIKHYAGVANVSRRELILRDVERVRDADSQK